MSAYVSLGQFMLAYVSLGQFMLAYVSLGQLICPHTVRPNCNGDMVLAHFFKIQARQVSKRLDSASISICVSHQYLGRIFRALEGSCQLQSV